MQGCKTKRCSAVGHRGRSAAQRDDQGKGRIITTA